MPQDFTLTDFTSLTENGAGIAGSALNTGDLRRKFNFGTMRLSSLNVAREPFYRLLSMYRTESTDDPQFKFTEERPSFHKRYGYVVGHSTDGVTYTTNNATVAAASLAQGATWYVQVKTDYKSDGNIGSRYGNSSSEVAVGATGTRPRFFIPGLKIKIITGTAYNVPKDFVIGRIESVTNGTSEDVFLKLHITRGITAAANVELQWADATTPISSTYNIANANIVANLESKKVYVNGNAFARGSGYPETWGDNPYSTGYGQTQIWKTALGMDNTTIATVLKYAPSEWARLWGNKLLEHKWDIETDLLFSAQYVDADGIGYTQGVLDYIVNYGSLFTLTHSTKTHDDFLDDLSQLLDPRMGSSKATVFLCDTYTYNWLNKLAGYFNNNINIDSTTYRGDFSFAGRANIGGVEVSVIRTIYGDMNVVRNVHLDGTGVKILGINLNHVKYRPLVGNGLNRDTSIYVGVQTIQNSGVDKRVDLILTEAGLEMSMPEAHVAWL